jgi:hypothetical protein
MIAALRRPITLRVPSFQPTRRHLWIVPGLAVAIAAGQVGDEHAIGLVPLLVFSIAPHVPAWLGRRTGRTFEVLHQPAVPAAIGALAVAGLLAPVWLVGALAWLGHIVIDWGFGAARLPFGGRGHRSHGHG